MFHSNGRSAGLLGDGKRFGQQAGNGLGAIGHPEQCACSTGGGGTPERAGGSSGEPSWGSHCTLPQRVFWGQGSEYLPTGGSSALVALSTLPLSHILFVLWGTLLFRDSPPPLLTPNTCGSSAREECEGSFGVPGIGKCLAVPCPWALRSFLRPPG